MEAHTFDPEAVSEEQRNSFFEIASGKHGDSLMEVFSFACPTIHEPVIALSAQDHHAHRLQACCSFSGDKLVVRARVADALTEPF